MSMLDGVDEVDALPRVPARRLTFEHATLWAEQAARDALAAVDVGNGDKGLLIIIERAAEMRGGTGAGGVDAWARRGCADGLEQTWRNLGQFHAAASSSNEQVAYCAAYWLCGAVANAARVAWVEKIAGQS